MKEVNYNIEIISAPSILGLKPTGVEKLGSSLLACGLAENLRSVHPIIHVPTLNSNYSYKRDPQTKCLNAVPIRDFSLTLSNVVFNSIDNSRFPVVLGGDCSVLLGIMSGLKATASYGIIFIDAHADFYEPEKSVTGQVADMDLAIITGRGPELLTNINNLHPYVKDENVIHIGQRDWLETKKYASADIRETAIQCFDLATIEKNGMRTTITQVLQQIDKLAMEGFWIHYDTDVLTDEINPAVDYRLPGGLAFKQVEDLIKTLLLTGKMAGISITIFNPKLDTDGSITKNLSASIARAFNFNNTYTQSLF